MTKLQKGLFETYKRATAEDLWQVYGRCSSAKRAAMERCREIQREMSGWRGRICSANSYLFTYGFLYKDCEGNICLCYITREHIRKFLIG